MLDSYVMYYVQAFFNRSSTHYFPVSVRVSARRFYFVVKEFGERRIYSMPRSSVNEIYNLRFACRQGPRGWGSCENCLDSDADAVSILLKFVKG